MGLGEDTEGDVKSGYRTPRSSDEFDGPDGVGHRWG